MKVLLISHTPISTQNNMGKTFRSLFSSFDAEELCQFYIYPSYPDDFYCSSFYRVTEKDLLKHAFPGGRVDETKIHSGQRLYEKKEDEGFYRSAKNKSAFRRIARDLLWFFGNWYNGKLKHWILTEQPTHIFLAPGPSAFIYSVCLKIAKDFDLPIFTYLCDEYYFVKPGKTLLEKIWQRHLKKNIEKVMKNSSHIFAISKEMKEAYGSHFSVPTSLLMTGSEREEAFSSERKEVSNFSYFGNIRLGRAKSLRDIGLALDEINSERKTHLILNIYTGEKDKTFLSVFDGVKSIRVQGFLSGDAYEKAMEETNVILHTESFEEEMIDRVRHSVSTKIASALASGIPLFAYGPKEVSSMKHLMENDCALCATKDTELKEKIALLLDSPDLRKKFVSGALLTAKTYHNATRNSKMLYDLMQNLRSKQF